MSYFFETYECKIDEKGRLKLPNALSKKLQEHEDTTLVLKRSVFQKCLEVYPSGPWNKQMHKLNRLNRFVKKNTDFIRMFTAGVKSVEPDKAERILIPKDLKQFSGLQKDVVISGVGEFFEIWNKEAYEENININEIEFAQLTEEVMGSIEADEQN
ncbi:division/cell wall cluster transcriptional repressor MraZ [Riemerella columbipharyngis]|uniref:Transcriptional regulator MraZ n=1 Tax=Riemerella columbipharyngis TaxID=1071918 RepID=A0A1G7F670_9FLAO|nr:division/cell wall cluster transcriptional repressor MraZ [Riemerella columbipharyngis]SDE71095.1 MraZ protein [Riemerella columbipharyngis]